jgi:hypothetical protein
MDCLRFIKFIVAVAVIHPGLAVAAEKANCQGAAGTRFHISGGLATDTKTGLIWQRCAVGMKFEGGTCKGEAGVFSIKNAEAVAKSTDGAWRVPSGEELQTLLDGRVCKGYAIDGRVFPDVPQVDNGEGAKYLTNTPFLPGMYYYFEFKEGYADMHTEGYGLTLRLVKGKAKPGKMQ